MTVHNFIDLTGKKFGRLTVRGRIGYLYGGDVAWSCECKCGNQKTIVGASLRNGLTKSCGCLSRELASKRKPNKTHGMSKKGEYTSWLAMKARCSRRSHVANHIYRDIEICQRWKDGFENFFEDMGHKPFQKATLERVDNTSGYNRDNCKWASYAEQAHNKRTNVWIEHNGIRMIKSDWIRSLGVSKSGWRYCAKEKGMSSREIISYFLIKKELFDFRAGKNPYHGRAAKPLPSVEDQQKQVKG